MADYTPYAPGINAARSIWDQGIVPLAEKARRYIQGAAEIFPTVSEYAREATPSSFVEDVRGVGGAMMEGIKEDPGRFMAELYPPVGASSAAFESNRLMDMAATAEKAGDLDRASTLRQLATFSGATAIPFLSPLRRLALTRKGMDPENIYYHGTASDIQREMIPSESGDLGPGVSLAAEPSLAEKRAIYQATGPSRGSGSGPNIMPMVVKKDLKLYETNRKPAQIDIDQLKADGYDGVTLIQDGELKELNVFEASNVEAAYKDLLNLPEGDPMLENLRQTMLRNAARRERGGIETIKESIPEGRRIDAYEPELDVLERQRRLEQAAPEASGRVLVDEWETSTGLSEPVLQNYLKLAEDQRVPELRMTEAQNALRGSPLSYLIEHVGDLTNRMGPQHPVGYAYRSTKTKIENALRELKSGYGFKRDYEEALRNNAAFNNIPHESYVASVNNSLDKYADAHQQLQTYVPIQTLARDAAVALGRRNFDQATQLLEELNSRIPTQETFISELTLIPDFNQGGIVTL